MGFWGYAAIAIGSAISGLAQAYVKHKSSGTSEAELKKIRDLWDKIVPPDIGISIEDPPEVIAEAAPPTAYDFSTLTPEDYQVVGTFAPEIAPHVAEVAPQVVADTAAGLEGQQAQLSALRRLQQIGEGGIDPQFAQRMREADQSSQQAAQSRQQSTLQDYARRGLLGSGTQLASDLAANEGAMQRGAQSSSDAATQAYLNQLGALQSGAQLGGNIRSQELDLQSRNAAIANSFNQRTSAAFQTYLQNQADLKNQAALRNLDTSQDISNRNVHQRNVAAEGDRDRQDRLFDRLRQQKIQNISAENVAGQANWKNAIDKIAIENAAKQQDFANKGAIIAGKQGAANPIIQNRAQQAQSGADVISGMGKAGTSAILSSMEADQREKDRDLKRDIYGV
jgi:hypothetical protein